MKNTGRIVRKINPLNFIGEVGESITNAFKERNKPIQLDIAHNTFLAETDFYSETFDHSDFVDGVFERANLPTVHDVLESVVQLKLDTQQMLEWTVQQKYTNFIQASNAISNMEEDMLELRNYFTEINAILKGMDKLHLNLDGPSTLLRMDGKLDHETQTAIQELLELPYEIDILTSERLFDKAIGMIEKHDELAQKLPQLAIAKQSIKEDLSIRISKMAEILIDDLQNPAIKKSECDHVISYLIRLGYSSKASQVFLHTRSIQINNDVRKLTETFDLKSYISEHSRIIFNGISSTCDDYTAWFPDEKMLSGFSVWAVHELQNFSLTFQRLAFGRDIRDLDSFIVVRQCFDIAQAHSKLLEDKGLSIFFYLKQQFHRDLRISLKQMFNRNKGLMVSMIGEETWDSKPVTDDEVRLTLTGSGSFVYFNIKQSVSVLSKVAVRELVPTMTSKLVQQLNEYYIELTLAVCNYDDETPKLNAHIKDVQVLAIISDAYSISHQLLSKVVEEYDREDKLNIGDSVKLVTDMRTKAKNEYKNLISLYCRCRADGILARKFYRNNTKLYGKDEQPKEPSDNFSKLISKFLYQLASDGLKILKRKLMISIITEILDHIIISLTEGDEFWKFDETDEECRFGEGGIIQYILDMKFIASASENCLSEQSEQLIKDTINRATTYYETKTGQKINCEERWYDRRIKNEKFQGDSLSEFF
eukprot:TRINITY_DN5894_c1_g1_i1.p1 TRINITY_DN5894_c1_g1~~TRINITY_DN5894_c1_g1_i1.p1  ORF type:complete len:706 (-),score=144.72 TRINITY_DN5894_c1_g1_i1:146-2263(-)